MDIVLFALRILFALALYAFLGVVLWALLREHRDANAQPTPAALVRSQDDGTPSQGAGSHFTLNPHAPTWIGRDPNCAIHVNSERASTRHARVDWRADTQAWWIEDSASRNGTLVNGERVMKAQLSSGDVIEIGGVQFRMETGDTRQEARS
jgi:predicted component of type VI protein secretion system